MHTPERPNADQFLARLRDDFANLAETLGAGTWDPPALRERLEQIRVARESALLNGFSGLAETISEIADACEACSEPEALHPSSVSVVVDAITGAETVVEAMSLGDLTKSLRPETIDALRALRPASPGFAEPSEPAIRFRRVDQSTNESESDAAPNADAPMEAQHEPAPEATLGPVERDDDPACAVEDASADMQQERATPESEHAEDPADSIDEPTSHDTETTDNPAGETPDFAQGDVPENLSVSDRSGSDTSEPAPTALDEAEAFGSSTFDDAESGAGIEDAPRDPALTEPAAAAPDASEDAPETGEVSLAGEPLAAAVDPDDDPAPSTDPVLDAIPAWPDLETDNASDEAAVHTSEDPVETEDSALTPEAAALEPESSGEPLPERSGGTEDPSNATDTAFLETDDAAETITPSDAAEPDALAGTSDDGELSASEATGDVDDADHAVMLDGGEDLGFTSDAEATDDLNGDFDTAAETEAQAAFEGTVGESPAEHTTAPEDEALADLQTDAEPDHSEGMAEAHDADHSEVTLTTDQATTPILGQPTESESDSSEVSVTSPSAGEIPADDEADAEFSEASIASDDSTLASPPSFQDTSESDAATATDSADDEEPDPAHTQSTVETDDSTLKSPPTFQDPTVLDAMPETDAPGADEPDPAHAETSVASDDSTLMSPPTFRPNMSEAASPTPGAQPDPNQPLDPTGGALDPNQPLDPTGGALDPNQPLDPTGGALDPNQPLDPTGGVNVDSAAVVGDEETESWGSSAIIIEEDRAELLQFMVTDVRASVAELEPILAEAYEFTSRQDAADRIVSLADDMSKVSEFFEFKSFETIVNIMREIGSALGTVGDAQLDEVCLRLRALGSLLDQYCSGLEVGMELSWPFKTFRRRIDLLLSGQTLHPDLVAWHRGDPERVLELDRVVDGVEELPNPPSETAGEGSASAAVPATARQAETKPAESKAPSVRVTQDSIGELFDIVRQLVLNKNQIESIALDARTGGLSREKAEPLTLRAAEFSRLVEQLQVSLSKTCVQPISMVLDRYERMIRDVAQLKDKKVDLQILGGDTRVDKFLLDEIADPLGRLLRYIVSRSIEPTAEREAAGKPGEGLLRVEAQDHESHITINISHDGEAPDADAILDEARGFDNAPADLEAMDARELVLLPLCQWYENSETAGVTEAFAAHNGSITLSTVNGVTTYQIVLPVSGAVLGVMNVRVGSGIYAIPVRSIEEIINLSDYPIQSVKGAPVLRVRDRVYPMIRCAQRFEDNGESDPGVAVIVSSDKKSVALGVDRVIGHQEIVIEPVGLDQDQLGPFLGGAIRSDGSVCLVVDVRRLIGDSGEQDETPALAEASA